MKYVAKLMIILASLITVNSYAVTTSSLTPQQLSDVKLIMARIKNKQLTQAEVARVQFPSDLHVDINSDYKVKTTDMTAGKIVSHQIETNIAQPVFIIGDDSQSIDWLKKNLPKLEKINAMGVLVNCSGKASYDAIQSTTKLPIVVISGHIFTQVFNLKNYPVLITSRSIEQ